MSRLLRIGLALVLLVGLSGLLLAHRARGGWTIAPWEKAELWCMNRASGAHCGEAGHAYENGIGPPLNVERALALYQRGCELKSLDACAYEASLRLKRPATDEERQAYSARLWYQCFRNEHAFSCLRLGHHAEARELAANSVPDSAIDAWSQGCKLEEERACEEAGRLLLADESAAAALEGLRMLATSCERGHLAACRRRADAYACGRGVEADLVVAIREYLGACRRGDSASCSMATSFHSVADEKVRSALPGDLQPISRREAIWAASRGDAARAEDLKGQLDELGAAWISAGLAFDAGNMAGARRELAVLRAAHPGWSEPEIFERVIAAVEKGQPAHFALIDGWARAGRPDLSINGLVLKSPEWNEIGCDAYVRHRLAPELVKGRPPLLDEAADRGGVPHELLDEAAAVPDDAPPSHRLGALAALRNWRNEKPMKEEWERADLRLSRSFSGAPRAYFAFIVLSGRPADEPLTPEELVWLFDARGWAIPKSELRAELARQVAALPADTHWTAEDTLGSMVKLGMVGDISRLGARAKVTAPALDSADRKRLAEALARIGGELHAGSWVLELAFGTSLTRTAADISGEPEHERLYEERRAAFRAVVRPFEALGGLGTWPSKRFGEALAEQIGDDEVSFAPELDRRVGR